MGAILCASALGDVVRGGDFSSEQSEERIELLAVAVAQPRQALVGTEQAKRADFQHFTQAGYYLWSRDTPSSYPSPMK